MTIEPSSQERAVRAALASEWHRKQCPVTQEGEDLLAERQALEARHALERRQWETKYARYLMQAIRPLEYSRQHKQSALPVEARKSA